MQKQNINGIVLLDKPQNISSNDALQKVKKIFQAKKAGHTGSLDPLATGVLPLCFGEATKFSHYGLNADKTYLVTAKLGLVTDTGDIGGNLIKEYKSINISKDTLIQTTQSFIGRVMQVPPMYSALKHNGTPLYKLAREGKHVERVAREINIFSLELNDFHDYEFSLIVHCSKGTYIRTLVEDIGQKLKTGATVTSLRRLQAGQFAIEQTVTLENLTEHRNNMHILNEYVLPVDSIIDNIPTITLEDNSKYYFLKGNAVQVQITYTHTQEFRVYSQDNQFLGVAIIDNNGLLQPKRLINI